MISTPLSEATKAPADALVYRAGGKTHRRTEGNDRASSVQLQAEDYATFLVDGGDSLPSGYCRSANENSDWPAATPMYCRPLTA
jgi:hypothetical protein